MKQRETVLGFEEGFVGREFGEHAGTVVELQPGLGIVGADE